MKKMLLSVGLLVLVGCQSPEQTAKQFDQNSQRLQQTVEALKAAGVETKVFARLRIDRIGSWETVLRGPGELDVVIVGEIEPEESNAQVSINVPVNSSTNGV